MEGFEDYSYLIASGVSDTVYLLYHDDTLQYVGKSCRLGQRVQQHLGRFPFNRVMAKVCVTADEASALELRLIRELQPIHNIWGKTQQPCAVEGLDLSKVRNLVSSFAFRFKTP